MPADWQSVRDKWRQQVEKPKNLGLKAQKTGITEALERVKRAEGNYLTTKADSVNELLEALHQVIVKSKAAIDKHKKIYTEACTYLEQVRDIATKRHIQVDNAKKVRTATVNR